LLASDADELARGRQLERAEELHLAPKLDTERDERAPPGLGHQRERLLGCRSASVLDEVRVPRGDSRTADPVALETACLEHPAGRELMAVRVREHAAERAFVRRLCRLSLALHLRDRRLDLVDRPRSESKLRGSDHLALADLRASVREPELGGRAPAGALPVHDERAPDDARPVAPPPPPLPAHPPPPRPREPPSRPPPPQ